MTDCRTREIAPEIRCRQLLPQDADAWFDVLHRGYQSLRSLPISFSAIDADRDTALDWFRAHPAYGLFCGEKLVSIVSLRMPWGALPGPECAPHIGWFTTDPDKKGMGYGKRLMHWLEEEILRKQLRAPYVTLGTAKEHPWLVSMYAGMGYEPFAEKQLPGKRHHTVFMRKTLGD